MCEHGRSGIALVVQPERANKVRQLSAIAVGAVVGFSSAQFLPVADTLVSALSSLGLKNDEARLIIAILLTFGGIEMVLVLRPFMEILASRRRKR